MAVGYRADAQNHTVSLALGTISQFTITCWVRINTDRNAFSTFWDVNTSSSNLFGFQTRSDGTTVETYDASGATGTHSAALTVGTWYYFAINVNGVNGNWQYRAANSSTFTAGTWTSGTATVGAATLLIGESGFNGEWGNVDVAALKMWHTVNLSTEQMHQESYVYLPQRSANLTCFYPLVGQTLTTDFSGNGRTLTGGSGASVVDGPPIVWGSAYPILFVPAGTSSIPKNVDDAGSSTESLEVSAAVNVADSGTSTESLSVQRFITLSDSGSSTESLSATVTTSLNDSSSGTESLSIAAAVSTSDTATASESLGVAAALQLSDSATGSDSILSGMPVSVSDSATSTESLSANASVSLSDTGSAVDSLSVVVTSSFADNGSSSELLSVQASATLTDSSSAAEALIIAASQTLADTGSALDGLAVGVAVTLGDAATASESLSNGEHRTLSDTGTATESLSVVVALSLTDSGHSQEVALADGMRFLYDSGTGTDTLHVSDGSSVIPGRMTLGDNVSPLMVLDRPSFSTVEGQVVPRSEMQSGDKQGSTMGGS